MSKIETATFAAGCFWGVEAAFRQVHGVVDAVSGYTGGHTQNPTYRQVSSGSTGHAEAVQVTFDPQQVSYDDLLRAFWQIHNPTLYDGRRSNVGSQYRSAIFVINAEQRERAETSLAREQQNHSRPICTEIIDASPFYPAEEHHQRYYEKHGVAACQVTV
jgi:peptide-methionine (S)-S-oxide reductase